MGTSCIAVKIIRYWMDMWTNSPVLSSVKLLNYKACCLLFGAAKFTLIYSSISSLGMLLLEQEVSICFPSTQFDEYIGTTSVHLEGRKGI